MKSLLIILILSSFLFSCKNKANPIINTVIVHDTVTTENPGEGPIRKSTLQMLLIQYYKKGWMDASNGIIELDNSGMFDDKHVLYIRNKHWRKIEIDVNSK